MKILYIIFISILPVISLSAQPNPLLEKYRQMALSYNSDLKAAEKNISIGNEMIQSAKQDALPKLGGNADFKYISNPMELSIKVPNVTTPLSFQGLDKSYGVSLSLLQPLYTGGRVMESIRIAQQHQSLAANTFRMIRSDVCYRTDLQYWNTVASKELASLYSAFYKSTKVLMNRVKERVDIGITDIQDLLMIEVKLNDAHYQMLRSINTVQTNCMRLNSLIGNQLNMSIDIDSTLISSIERYDIQPLVSKDRSEIHIANDNIAIQESSLAINDSKYKPQLYIGAEGSYSSPGFNFKTDMDPNYAIYAKVTVPIFEWGKRRSDKRADKYKIGIARDNLDKIIDEIELQVQSAKIDLIQSKERVKLTDNSLDKAIENERKSTERYIEGKSSIIELLDARFYKLTTQINFVQAKLSMHINYSELLRAIDAYSLK